MSGVSIGTVSQILNGRRLERYSDETRHLVHESAVKVRYKPNFFAGGLRTQRSRVMVSNQIVTTPYAGKIVLGAQQTAQKNGLVLMVVNSEGDRETETKGHLSTASEFWFWLTFRDGSTFAPRVVPVGRGPCGR